jgi:catechol 2,3-dioxygenase-like lactoylglutathione lyase family enzyme
VIDFKYVHHVTHFVWDLKSTEAYLEEKLGVKPFRKQLDLPTPKPKTIFYRIGPTMYLFKEPGHTYTPEFEAVRRNGGPVVNHVGLAVADIEARVAELRKAGVQFIQDAPVVSSHGGYKVIDIDPESAAGSRAKSAEFLPPKLTPESYFGVRLQLCEDLK